MRLTRSVPVAVVATALALSACSSGGSGPGTGVQPSLSGSALVAAAKKEGRLTFYTTYTSDEANALSAAFDKAYPGVKITVLQGSVDKLTARIITEQKAKKFNSDVFQGDASYATQLIRSGVLQPYDAPDRPDASGLHLPAGYANVDAVLTTVVAYNPSALAALHLSPPTGVADLTRPQWKGNFGVDDAGVNWYESLVASMGHEKAEKLVKSLGSNSPRLQESHTLAMTQVAAGEPAATVAAYGYKAAAAAKKDPKSIGFVNPNPLPSAPDVVEVVHNAPHLQAARLFLNWLESKAGQQALVRISGRISLRPDVASDPAAWNPKKWRPAWSTPSAPATIFDKYAAELKSAFGAK